MTQEDYRHPIAPPPELVQQWGHDADLSGVPHNDEHWAYEEHIANRAAQWGADQELEACLEWLKGTSELGIDLELVKARRPKPPSLKEQALLALSHLVKGADESMDTTEAAEYIRRALEQLPDAQ
jgi:hypothetical protein